MIAQSDAKSQDGFEPALAVVAPSWEDIGRSKRAERDALIPEAWRLPDEILGMYEARPISIFDHPVPPAVCPNILSQKELELTSMKHEAHGLVLLLQSATVTAVEMVTAFCKRAAIAHQLTNCLSEIMFEPALRQAQEADQQRQSIGKTTGLLHGLPITVKDSFFMKGYDASIGISSLCSQPATQNSQMVDIMQAYGAVIIAKTTVPQTMLTADTESIVFGRTVNAHRGTFGAGGSSGGEGVVVAMGGSALGIGTDGAGSVRMPAFVNGIVGYKPSGYRIPLDGRGILGKGLMGTTCIGPVSVSGLLTRSARDARQFAKMICDAEPWKTSPFLLPSPWSNIIQPPLRPLRLGVWRNHDHVHLLPPVARGFTLAQQRLAAAGHVLVDFDGPSITEVWTLQKEFVVVQDLRPLREMIATEPMTEIVRRTDILAPKQPAPEVTLDRIHELNGRVANLLISMVTAWNKCGDVDALLWVPAAHPALPFDAYTDLGMTGLFNVIDWPAVVLPLNETVDATLDFDGSLRVAGEQLFSETDRRLQDIYYGDRQAEFNGLPLSVQLIGRRGLDESLLSVATTVHSIISERSPQ